MTSHIPFNPHFEGLPVMKDPNPALPLLVVGLLFATTAAGGDEKSDRSIKLAEAKLKMTYPEKWQKKKPAEQYHRVRIRRFPRPTATKRRPRHGDGRRRQRRRQHQALGRPVHTARRRRRQGQAHERKIAGQDVHCRHLGHVRRQPPLAGPGVKRPGYRMLAAIIASKKVGQLFSSSSTVPTHGHRERKGVL